MSSDLGKIHKLRLNFQRHEDPLPNVTPAKTSSNDVPQFIITTIINYASVRHSIRNAMVNAYRNFERPRQDSSFFVFPVPFATLSCDRSVYVGSRTAFRSVYLSYVGRMVS